eukprot:gene11038-18641_t
MEGVGGGGPSLGGSGPIGPSASPPLVSMPVAPGVPPVVGYIIPYQQELYQDLNEGASVAGDAASVASHRSRRSRRRESRDDYSDEPDPLPPPSSTLSHSPVIVHQMYNSYNSMQQLGYGAGLRPAWDSTVAPPSRGRGGYQMPGVVSTGVYPGSYGQSPPRMSAGGYRGSPQNSQPGSKGGYYGGSNGRSPSPHRPTSAGGGAYPQRRGSHFPGFGQGGYGRGDQRGQRYSQDDNYIVRPPQGGNPYASSAYMQPPYSHRASSAAYNSSGGYGRSPPTSMNGMGYPNYPNETDPMYNNMMGVPPNPYGRRRSTGSMGGMNPQMMDPAGMGFYGSPQQGHPYGGYNVRPVAEQYRLGQAWKRVEKHTML